MTDRTDDRRLGTGPPTTYPEQSSAVVALVLGVLGVVGLYVLGPFAWWLGVKERRAIENGRRDPANRGLAIAGQVLGVVATVGLLIVPVLLLILATAGALSSLTGADS